MRHFLINLTAIAALLISPTIPTAAAAVDANALADDVLARNNRIVTKLVTEKTNNTLTNASALVIIQAEISPILNFPKITRRAMGKFWKKTDEADQQRVITAFQKLLENTYAKVLTRYKDQKVKKLEVKSLPGDKVSVVVGVSDASRSVMINYVFSAAKDGSYLISDIKVEQISLISNYRRQFKRLISTSGVDGLVKKLEALVQ